MPKLPKNICPFCEPNVGTFAKTESFLAIYNIAPCLPGHILVAPKLHIETINGLTRPEFTEMMMFIMDLSNFLKTYLSATGFDLILQEGADAGQTIDHLHLHIIPRRPNDLPNVGDWIKGVASPNSQIVDSSLRPRLSAASRRKISKTFAREYEKFKLAPPLKSPTPTPVEVKTGPSDPGPTEH